MHKILKHQQWHFLILFVLLLFLYMLAQNDSNFLSGQLSSIGTSSWVVIAILPPIVHQIYVLLVWRSELHFGSITKLLGTNGFKIYKIGFALLMLSRLITIILLALSNAKTLSINSNISYGLSVVLFIPAAYLFYSVAKYFGVNRAIGIDHFQAEIFKAKSFVKQGIFKYTSNGMYVFGLLILWIPGLLLQSKAAIALAAFNHIYIWVHYYFTELPDMKFIYGKDLT